MKQMSIETPLALMTLLLETKKYIEDKANHSEEVTKTLTEISKGVRPYDEQLANTITELTNKIHTWYGKDRGPILAMYVKTMWENVFRQLFRLAETSENWRLEI